MWWLKLPQIPDALYEILVIIWIVASPLAVAQWVQDMNDPTTWAAFTAGVLGVAVGWLVVAPQQLAKQRKTQRSGD